MFKLTTLLLFSTISCCLSIQLLSLKTLTVEFRDENETQQRALLEKKVSELSAVKRVPNFGFGNLVSDWMFLDFLQYFGDDVAREKLGYSLTPNFFEAIIRNDPYYRKFYLFLSGSGSIYAAQPKESVRLMEMGLAHLSPNKPSDSYYIWRYKGIDELLLLIDGEAAQQSFEMAAIWAEKSHDDNSERFEQMSRQTAQYLLSNPKSRTAQAAAWSSILTTALDDATREQAVTQIEALGGRVSFSEDGGIKIEFVQETAHTSDS